MDANWIVVLCVGLAMLAAGTLLQYLGGRRRGEARQDVWCSISDQWGLKEAREMVTDRGMATWVAFVVLFGAYLAWQSNSFRYQIFIATVLLAAAVCGWFIRRRFGTLSLGPYGATFLVAFLMIVWLPIR